MRILSPHGRLNRLHYFLQSFGAALAVHAAVAAYFVWTVAGLRAAGAEEYEDVVLSGDQAIALVALFLFSLLCGWILLVSQIKRLRDLNQSGWLVLINLIPGAGLFLWIVLVCAQKGSETPPPRFSPA